MNLNETKFCDVSGCMVNSQNDPESYFFIVPTDNIYRRSNWLQYMGRKEFIEADFEIYVCDRHFQITDLIETPNGYLLRKNAEPSLFMPRTSIQSTASQAKPEQNSSETQTEGLKGISHMVCQAGIALITDLRNRKSLQEEYNKLVKRTDMSEVFRSRCYKYLGRQTAEAVNAIVDKLEGKEYSLAYKIFCLKLYYVSPRAYSLMSEDFQLPPIGKLKEIDIPVTTELDDDLLKPFRINVSRMTESEKYCSVAVNIVRLKYKFFYSEKQDKIIGFHEINGLQSPIPARYAVVMVARGILINWSQPISFAYLSALECREAREEVSRWITKILSKLLEIGLYVKTFVCTASTKLLNEANIRLVSIDKPYFLINGIKIYYIYDFPHMLRMLRNYFLTHNFIFGIASEKSMAKFNDVKEFYHIDKIRPLRIADALTDSHITPTVKEKRITRYAKELFSRPVAAGMNTFIKFKQMQESAKDTTEFIAMINDLYEMLHSTSLTEHTFRGYEKQTKFLTDTLKKFKFLKLVNSDTGEEITSNLLFIKGLQVNIKSVLLLFEEMKEKSFKHLFTGRLYLDVTEPYIKKIKTSGIKTIEPTCQRFGLKFRRLYSARVMKPQIQKEVSDELIEAVVRYSAINKATNKDTTDNQEEAERPTLSNLEARQSIRCIADCDIMYRKHYNLKIHGIDDSGFNLDAKELNRMAKLASTVDSYHLIQMLIKKCVEYHNCLKMQQFLKSFEMEHSLGDYDDDDVIMVPDTHTSAELFSYIAQMEDRFREVFDECRISRNLSATIHTSYKNDVLVSNYMPLPCFPVTLFQKLFIKIRIYMTVNYNNSEFKKKDALRDKCFSIPGL